MVALVLGVLVGAGLVFALLRGGLQRSESAADAAARVIQQMYYVFSVSTVLVEFTPFGF